MNIFYYSQRNQLHELLGTNGSSQLDAPNLREESEAKKSKIKINRPTNKAKRKFEEDYPPFLIAVSSSIRSGLDPFQAICSVQTLLPAESLLRSEIEAFEAKINSGASDEEAIFSFGSSINHPDIRLFTTALLLARKEGSSLGACLQRLNRFTRQRQGFRRKARAAVAMQRLSSFGIAGCSLVIGGMQIFTNASGFSAAWNHPLGFWLLVSGASLLFTGMAWMMYLGRSRI